MACSLQIGVFEMQHQESEAVSDLFSQRNYTALFDKNNLRDHRSKDNLQQSYKQTNENIEEDEKGEAIFSL